MSSAELQQHPGLYTVRYEKTMITLGGFVEIRRTVRKGIVKERVVREGSFGQSFMRRVAYNNQGDLIGSVDRGKGSSAGTSA